MLSKIQGGPQRMRLQRRLYSLYPLVSQQIMWVLQQLTDCIFVRFIIYKRRIQGPYKK